ncbi:MAG: hypothetical protein Q7T54_01585 [Candidatus Levybacteria bacterium]|nr:hypothetical protein [Candidatus Levybacteria bacterium]
MNIKQKLTSAAVIGAMMAAVVAPASFAATVKIKKNGAGSTNTATVVSKKKTIVSQYNGTAVVNLVGVLQNTGVNSANGNTGDGSVDVNSGAATSTVTNTTTTGGNNATVNPCGCVDPSTNVVIKKNGAGSTNTVTVVSTSKTEVEQVNETLVINGVLVAQNTGGNSANGNTGDGGVNVDSGNATSTVTNTTTTGGNAYTPTL